MWAFFLDCVFWVLIGWAGKLRSHDMRGSQMMVCACVRAYLYAHMSMNFMGGGRVGNRICKKVYTYGNHTSCTQFSGFLFVGLSVFQLNLNVTGMHECSSLQNFIFFPTKLQQHLLHVRLGNIPSKGDSFI